MEENLRLLSAAIGVRDSLRAVILPGLDQLAKRATQPETVALIQTLRIAVFDAYGRLEDGHEDRKFKPRSSAADLPCWKI